MLRLETIPGQLSAAEVLVETAKQVNKDANRVWVETRLTASPEVFAQELFTQVSCALREVLTHHSGALNQVFYRFDVDEKKLHEIMTVYVGDALIEALAVLLLNRAMSKVILRRTFSSSPQP